MCLLIFDKFTIIKWKVKMMYIVDTFSHVQNTSSRMSCRKRHILEHMMPRYFESPVVRM